jgi:[protein-PII] uridylyltransferase
MLRASFPIEALSAFQASMPERYRREFDSKAIREHAAIVARRGEAPLHLEVWQRLPRGGAVLVAVADDRPGLLSFISASLVVNQMDVVGAQVYTRVDPRTGRREAVDFLWLQRDAALALPVLIGDVTRIGEVLRSLILEETTVEAVVRRGRPVRPAPPGASTRVTFEQNPDDGAVALTVQTFDRPGLLLAITQSLFRAGVQIIASDASTRAGRVVDCFTIVELDGTPIRPARRGLLQMEVLAAIDAVARGSN